MGSLCGSSQTTQQQSSSTPTGLPQLNSIWNQVQQVANQPYTPYSGQLVAGLTPEQQTGISNVNAAYGTAQPYFNQAAQYATAGAQPISAAAIQGYQSPYTQQVVDATQAQFNNQNAQQQNSLKGNLAMSNALGGDRQAVAQSVLAGQQKLAQAPTIAGLYNQSYGQALSAAQADRAAQGQAAYTFGALAPSVQNANLQGAQAQLGAGQLEQSTNQAGLSAAYNQYLQQLAFPYQQAGFLASAGLPAVTAMGGSQAGSTTSPGPNPWAQVAGLGIAGASLLSDARVKTDKRQVGKTFDGQPIYTFRYEGSPYTQMGLMAQEVEKKHPEAVGEAGGLKTVDYEAATPIKKAGGGPVGLFDVQTYVPRFGGVSAAPVNYGHAPNAPSQAAMPSFSPQSIVSAGKGLQGLFGSDDPTPQTGYTGVSGEAFPGMSDATTGYQGGVPFPIFGEAARGGRIGYADGGGVDFDAAFSPFAIPPDNTPSNRALALALADKYQPQGDIALNAGAPLPRPRPFEAPGVPVGSIPDDGGLPTTAISPAAARVAMPASAQPGGALPDDALAYDVPDKVRQPLTDVAQFQSKSNPIGGWNPFNLSDDARLGIAAAGLGMAAARTPFALSAAGEGGLAGLKTYEQQKQQRQSAELAARKLMQSADQFGQTLGVHKDTLAETARAHKASELQHQAQLAELKRQHDVTGMQPVTIGNTASGLEIKAVRDPKSGGFRVIDPNTGALLEPGQGLPSAKPGGPGYVDPRTGRPIPPTTTAEAGEGVIPANAQLVSSGTPYDYSSDAPYLEKGMDVPKPAPTAGKSTTSVQTDAEYYLQTGKLPPIAKGKSPVAVQTNNYRTAVQNYGNALATSRGISPEQAAEMWRTAPGMLRYVMGADGRATVALGTAVRHLDSVQQLAKAWDANDTQAINRLRGVISRQFGSDAATNLEAAGRIVGPEIIKALGVAGAGTEHDRNTASAMFDAAKSPAQLAGAVQTVQKLLAGQLEGKKRQAAAAGVSEERFKNLIGDRPYEILSHAEKPGGGGSAPPASPQDKQALDWANANPNDPRAAEIKKKLGVQ